jgi:hypothetical protein
MNKVGYKRNEQYEIAERYYKGTPYEKKFNGYDLYSYGKILLNSRNNPYGRVSMHPSQVSQSFYQYQDCLNQLFSVNPNQSMCLCRREVNQYRMQSRSFYQNSERSFDLNSSYSFEFRYDASPVKKPHFTQRLQYCTNKCEDLENDLKRLKESTINEREDFRQKLKELQRLILEKTNTFLVVIGMEHKLIWKM